MVQIAFMEGYEKIELGKAAHFLNEKALPLGVTVRKPVDFT